MKAPTLVQEQEGLRVVAYPGNNKILLAMSLADNLVNNTDKNLAGFAIWRRVGAQPEVPLENRINFTTPMTKDTKPDQRKWTPSSEAPFQKFRWVDVPTEGFDSPITYRVQALYFVNDSRTLTNGPEVMITVPPIAKKHANFHPGFTRGYIASQAYADKFHNADIRPAGPKAPDFDTTPFEAQYAWLGADARTKLFQFLKDCEDDKTAKIDVFIYDFDEPKVLEALCRLGTEGRLRAILDNADLHTKPNKKGELPPEVKAAQMVIATAGKANVKQGKFARFQHNKVVIKRDRHGIAQRVFFGSMNFSVRGLYVQANNVIVVDDTTVAGYFAKAFDLAFQTGVKAPPFAADPISAGFMIGSTTDTPQLPKFSMALSPHKDWKVSLDPMSARIRSASSSVLYAVMEPTGQGPVLASLQIIAANPIVFSYGTVETDSGLAVQSPNGAMGAVTGFAALTKNVPAPFTKEFSGGSGMHIHNKFVVVDFNDANPTVFTGSSNLASGGETANGDSLVMIEDAAVANMYAIEAVAQFDHYHFRSVKQKATKNKPLTLWFPGKKDSGDPWWKAYYDPAKIQMRDRYLFASLPLPAGMQTMKSPDWISLEKAAAAAAAAKKKAKKAASKKTSASSKKAPAKKKKAEPAKKKATNKKTSASSKKAPAKKKAGPVKKKATNKKTSASSKKAPAKKKPPAKKKART